MIYLKVREIAESQGYNMSTLSRKADVPFLTIKRVWKNPHYELKLGTLQLIARALGVKTSELIEDVEESDGK